MTLNYAFFRGCFIPNRAPHIEKAAETVLPRLGVTLEHVPGFTCCPEPVGFSLHEKLTWLTVAARNISLAEEKGLDILTQCNGCYYTLEHTVEELKDMELRDRVNAVLADTGHEYKGTSKVRHFVQVITEDIGAKKVQQLVKKPLTGLNVAAHTGCHFSNVYGKNAEELDNMISTLGALSVDYELKNLCCGWTLGAYGDPEEGQTWLKNRLESMNNAGADCIGVICPQCYNQFDTGQMLTSRKVGLDFKLPALYYLQLLGLAMGYSLEEVGYKAHRVKDAGFESKIRSITGE